MDRLIAVIIVCAIAAPLVYKFAKHGGFQGAMFGARPRTRGQSLNLQSSGLCRMQLRVYVLSPADQQQGPHIGIEASGLFEGNGSIPLSRDEAKGLIEELSRALKESEAASSANAG